jgi:hypothetical protein
MRLRDKIQYLGVLLHESFFCCGGAAAANVVLPVINTVRVSVHWNVRVYCLNGAGRASKIMWFGSDVMFFLIANKKEVWIWNLHRSSK